MPDPTLVSPVKRDLNTRAITLLSQGSRLRLSVVIPCYNEERSLEACVASLVAIQDDALELEVILVDDCSKDDSYAVAQRLAQQVPGFKLLRHSKNQGKGAALRTGIAEATGDFVAIQDADREYDPTDLKRLIGPLRDGIADVVIGSRFLSSGYHRVLYFWHSVGNKFLTLVSNMLTDLNLTDMESCYKVFRRDIIQSIRIEENRFGFEPEVVAKMAQMRVRIYEMGISYQGRSYAEGKKIGARDGWRALYCILKYNLPRVPAVVQFCFYTLVGGLAAVVNFILFVTLYRAGVAVSIAALSAFFLAAGVNYLLSIWLLFRHRARWKTFTELLVFLGVVSVVGAFDLYCTKALIALGIAAPASKLIATALGLVFNFLGRRYFVFPEKSNPDWKPQHPE